MIDKPQGSPEENKPEQKESGLPSTVKVTLDSSPASARQPKETNTSKKRRATKYVMWPIVAIWRGIKVLWGWRAIPFRYFEQHHAAVTAFATLAIVGLTYEYVQYSKKQWQVAQDTLRVSQGAYVTIGTRDGKAAEFFIPQNPKGTAEIVVYFRNSGHIPAKLNWGTLLPVYTIPQSPDFPELKSLKDWNPMVRTRNRKDGSTQESGAITIAGDSVFPVGVVEMPAERAIKQAATNNMMIFWGAYEYCDSTGNYSCKDFHLFYRGGNRFEMGGGYECADYVSRPANPNPDLEYLPACRAFGEKPPPEPSSPWRNYRNCASGDKVCGTGKRVDLVAG